ncbi:hypothetical protein ACLKQ9_004751, partial [Escherichia coli]
NNVMQPFFWPHIVQTACADLRVQHRRMFATAVGTCEQLSTPRLLAGVGMRTISWTALSFQPALLALTMEA